MRYQNKFWRVDVFLLAMSGSALFVALTFIAMFFFPGGTLTNPNTQGYSFFHNFFSELGFFVTKSGAPNTISASLFMPALTMAGGGLALFFFAFPQFFEHTPLLRRLSALGSFSGILAGICFVGVAFTPADIFLDAHYQFVIWAFRFFPLAVCFYIPAIFLHPTFPRGYGWLLVGFLLALVAYLLLLEFGPSATSSPLGNMIQVVGQKLIVYASIGCVLFLAWGALRTNQKAQ
jgi:hypothetical protein